jgi:hypothetical protein
VSRVNASAAQTANQINVGNPGDAVLFGPLGNAAQWGGMGSGTSGFDTSGAYNQLVGAFTEAQNGYSSAPGMLLAANDLSEPEQPTSMSDAGGGSAVDVDISGIGWRQSRVVPTLSDGTIVYESTDPNDQRLQVQGGVGGVIPTVPGYQLSSIASYGNGLQSYYYSLASADAGTQAMTGNDGAESYPVPDPQVQVTELPGGPVAGQPGAPAAPNWTDRLTAGLSDYWSGTGAFAPTTSANQTLGSAIKDTGRTVLNAGLGFVESTDNLLSGALPGTPDYVPFLSGYRSQYDTPAFGTTVEALTGVGVLKVLGSISAAGEPDVVGAQAAPSLTSEATESASITRTFTAHDPLVGPLATRIEAEIPGSVMGTDMPIGDASLGKGASSDADIALNSGDIIEVKSGGGTGVTTQIQNQMNIMGDSGEVILYGPDLKGSVVKGVSNLGVKVFTSQEDLIAYIKSKGN